MTIELTSPAFAEGAPIPARYTADGEDVSVPLKWSGAPDGTRSIALICDDPDAPRPTPWVHWVLYGLPPTVTELPEGVPATRTVLSGAKQGANDWRRIGYGGPAPPSGTHRYFFRLYALDIVLDLQPGATKQDLLRAMEGHILAQGQLMGTYKR